MNGEFLKEARGMDEKSLKQWAQVKTHFANTVCRHDIEFMVLAHNLRKEIIAVVEAAQRALDLPGLRPIETALKALNKKASEL